MQTERRKSPRVRSYLPVQLHQSGGASLAVETLTKNVGLGGIRCISHLALPVGTELSVQLVLAQGEDPLILRGRAVWFHMLPHSEQFDIGVRFVDVDKPYTQRLTNYVEHLTRQLPDAANTFLHT